MPLGMEVDLSSGDFVLDGYPAPLPKKGRSPQFSAHVYCGQTAGWMKTPLGTEVDLGQGHIVLYGVRALPKGAQQPLLFSVHVYCGHGRLSQLLLKYFTCAKEDVTVVFVCVVFCLLSTLRKNFRTHLHEIFRESWQWATEQTNKFSW